MRSPAAAALLAWIAAAPVLGAQSLRVSTWASYDAVTASDDWTAYGAQLTWANANGHAVWGNVELVSRFGLHDGTEKIGGVLHPAPRWWFTLEAGTALGPEVVPKNSWELDATALATRHASPGLSYRRQNYVPGPVDMVIPHVLLQLGKLTWDARVFLSRNPSDRTDGAFLLRVTAPLSRRAAGWIGGAAGRESYLVGAPPAQAVRSLRTVTGIAGVRVNLAHGFTVRIDVTVINSKPVLSRRGISLGAERQL